MTVSKNDREVSTLPQDKFSRLLHGRDIFHL